MKLKSCYIENFGKLHKFSYEFKDGINLIEEENGWGKTSFAAFIKAMFFGLEYTRASKLTDRKQYLPWNGMKFGGTLTFEYENGCYKIERFFGKTDKDDTFILYDVETNLVSDKFSANIGEEIWKVDRSTFENTAFLTLTESELLNDIISSKLGDLKEQEADMEESSKVIERLEKEATLLKAKRGKSGLIDETITELEKTKDQIKEIQSLQENCEIRRTWIEKEKDLLAEYDQTIDELEKKHSSFVYEEKNKQYTTILEKVDEKLRQKKQIESLLSGAEIENEQLTELENVRIYLNLQENVRNNTLSREQQEQYVELNAKFENKVPTEEELETCNRKITKLSQLSGAKTGFQISSEDERRWSLLKEKFADMDINETMLGQCVADYSLASKLEQKIELLGEEQRKKQRQQEQEQLQYAAKKKKNNIFYICGFLLIVFGALSIAISPYICFLLLILGVILFVLPIFFGKTVKDTSLESEISNLNGEVIQLTEELQGLQRSYLPILTQMNERQDDVLNGLSKIKEEYRELNRFNEMGAASKEASSNLEREENEIKKELEDFLSNYFVDFAKSADKPYEHLIEELQRERRLYLDYKNIETRKEESIRALLEEKEYLLSFSTRQYEDELKKKELFESENNMEEMKEILNNASFMEFSMEEILQQRREIEVLKKEASNKIVSYEKDILQFSNEIDMLPELESSIIRLGNEIEELTQKLKMLQMTKDYMILAKERLAKKYVKDIYDGFLFFLEKFQLSDLNSYKLDIHLNVKKEEGGELHGITSLSEGYKDLMELCLRLALIKAVYKEVEKPILIIDDPFVNLDNEKLEAATSLLRDMGNQYQMIYFLCHSSRTI